MADAVLLRRVQLGGSLAALRQKKKRIVTEAARAARRARDLGSPASPFFNSACAPTSIASGAGSAPISRSLPGLLDARTSRFTSAGTRPANSARAPGN